LFYGILGQPKEAAVSDSAHVKKLRHNRYSSSHPILLTLLVLFRFYNTAGWVLFCTASPCGRVYGSVGGLSVCPRRRVQIESPRSKSVQTTVYTISGAGFLVVPRTADFRAIPLTSYYSDMFFLTFTFSFQFSRKFLTD